jgi:hypothetical protein
MVILEKLVTGVSEKNTDDTTFKMVKGMLTV